ncbi:interleukin-13 receptor subunit alpha-1 [Hylobates moloch]|uniref:interleukin-13 receptor subunit alpha-1 n=1 Tax=Hylobates moloch TaxID=81572 RepID=UPI0013F203C1|nr:interleukin-13 receptor subunit alpha-1 [Hylobates moloch]
MEWPARLCGLWALLLCAGGGGGGAAPTETQPPVTNLSVSVENLCTVIWTWNPPEGASPNCSLWYFSHFGDKQDKKIAPETRRSKEVPLNERICLQVGSQCSTNESEKPSILVEKCISPPEGDPESAVTELQCIWHNLSYMKCSWLPGRNTSPNTNYTLYYCCPRIHIRTPPWWKDPPGKVGKSCRWSQKFCVVMSEHWKKYDICEKQTKEETDSVVLIENLKKASQ